MKLHQNVGTLDRVVRLLAAAGLAALAVAGIPAVPFVYATLTLAAILAVTGLVGFCPIYALLGIRTVAARQ